MPSGVSGTLKKMFHLSHAFTIVLCECVRERETEKDRARQGVGGYHEPY